MTTKTKFKNNPVARKIREEALERERGTQESVKRIKRSIPTTKDIPALAPESVDLVREHINRICDPKNDTTYWSKTGTEVKEFDLDSALALARNEGYEEGYKKATIGFFKGEKQLIFFSLFFFFVCIGLFAWIVTH